MSRVWAWTGTALATAFLVAAALSLGIRWAKAQGAGSSCTEVRTWLEETRNQLAQANRLLELYRQRERVYRERLEEANRTIAELSGGGRHQTFPRFEREHEEPWEWRHDH
ncbi:MAG: hypothetical protein QN193_03675 [Armatimonadota bacterium]|nr:hypothetical protein [Armatimonadota bacterium]MDR7444321.1 hypothetical protein [Armatimonadota bacterium]MDR7569688.1 hypothetical protein [Armatimonadota bacterium]MDR7614808.1 hypothetical protein [Armatimonadota bacterium]